MGRIATLAALAAIAGCGRRSFQLTDDGALDTGQADAPDVATTPEGWVVFLGGGTEPTAASDIVEDAAGDLWILGTSADWGPAFRNPFAVKLDGDTGAVILGGQRSIAASGEGYFSAAVLGPAGLVVAGSHWDVVNTQQPSIAIIDPQTGMFTSAVEGGAALANLGRDAFHAIARGPDDGMLAVGTVNNGADASCTPCLGTDALAVKISPSGMLEYAYTLGTQFGDESSFGVIALPDGSYIATGGGFGNYAYNSMGDVDVSPSYVYRLSSTGALMWLREVRTSSRRGARVHTGVYDDESGTVILVGALYFGTVPFVAQMNLDGTVMNIREVVLDEEGAGAVTSVALAPDGGLFLGGFEDVTGGTSTSWVARLDATRSSFVWALRVASGQPQSEVIVRPSQRGDLVVAVPGGGSLAEDAVIVRVTQAGEVPACWTGVTAAALSFRELTDASAEPGYMVGDLSASTTLDPKTPVERDPMVAMPYAGCP